MEEEADAQRKALSGQMFTAVPRGWGGRLCEELPGLHGWNLVGKGRILHQRWLLKGLALLFLLLLELQEFKCRDLGLTNCLSQLSTDLVG